VPDTVVVLSGLIGVASATLGTTAGANVVQLVDTTPPEPIGFALTTDGFAVNFAENAFATTTLAMSMQKNGSGPIYANPASVDTSGTTSLTFHYTGLSMADTDWAMMNYTATNAGNGLSDAAGNALTPGGSAIFAEGGSGNNTIDLSAFSAGYDINGNAGNDTIIGSTGGDWISGGTGADTMTGGVAGNDYFGFEQGDSPAGVVSLGVNGLLDNGDTFTFASGVDRITDFASGEGFNLDAPNSDLSGLPGVGWMGAQTESPSTSVLPTNGLAIDQGFFLTQGNYSGTTFTVNSTGADTLVMYDGDSTGGVTQTGIVLSGVTLAQLNAYAGNNWISHT
jgi:hypothetical protein